MKRKIVVLYKHADDHEKLAEIFEESVQQGLEVFFCEKKETALELLASEKPHLLVVDGNIDLPLQEIPTILIHDKREKTEGLTRLFHKNQVLEKCLPILDLAHLENPQEIPM